MLNESMLIVNCMVVSITLNVDLTLFVIIYNMGNYGFMMLLGRGVSDMLE